MPLTTDDTVLLSIEPSAAFGEPIVILSGDSTSPGVLLAETANAELQGAIDFQAGRLDFLGESASATGANGPGHHLTACRARPLSRRGGGPCTTAYSL
jgi:hypothetical protein